MITTLIFKTDKRLKEEAQKVAKEMGLPLSAYLNEQLRGAVSTRQANFRAPLVPNKKTAKYLRRVLKDADESKNMSPVFTSTEDMDKWLDS
jgi:antitoxin component of RelBE/YafQ-DinJ toxin-antitoxin module